MARTASFNVFQSILLQPKLTVRPNDSPMLGCRCVRLLPCFCPTSDLTLVLGSGVVRKARDAISSRQRGDQEKKREDHKLEELLKLIKSLRQELLANTKENQSQIL